MFINIFSLFNSSMQDKVIPLPKTLRDILGSSGFTVGTKFIYPSTLEIDQMLYAIKHYQGYTSLEPSQVGVKILSSTIKKAEICNKSKVYVPEEQKPLIDEMFNDDFFVRFGKYLEKSRRYDQRTSSFKDPSGLERVIEDVGLSVPEAILGINFYVVNQFLKYLRGDSDTFLEFESPYEVRKREMKKDPHETNRELLKFIVQNSRI